MFPFAILSFCLFTLSIALSPESPSTLSDPSLPGFPSQFNSPPPGSISDQNRPDPPLVNQSAWILRASCSRGPGRSLDEVSCMCAINKMLIQHGSAETQTFGTEGSYTGPKIWIWGPCTIVIELRHIRAWSNSLLIFAKYAAQVNDICPRDRPLYYGGFCDIINPDSMQFIRLAVTRTPYSVSHDKNATSILSSSPGNITALLRSEDLPILAARGSQSSSKTVQ